MRVKLLRHLEGDHSSHGPSSQKVRPRRLHGLQGLDVVGRHVFDPRVGVLSVFQAPGLQTIAGLVGTQKLRQMNVGENVSASRMHQEERPPAATRLNGHQRGLRAGCGLLTENPGEMLNRCSLKDGRQQKFFTQPFFDEGEQTYRQQRVPPQLKKVVSHPDRPNAQNLLPDVRELEFQVIAGCDESFLQLRPGSIRRRQCPAV